MDKLSYKDIYIKYHEEDNPNLELTAAGDWCDLYLAEDITLYPQDFALLSLGVSMQLPPGYEAIIAPRSSTFLKYGILQANGIGIVDNNYNGDSDIWKMPVYATRYVEIKKGTRLCQFRIQQKQPNLNFIKVQSLENEARGGFGSTGD